MALKLGGKPRIPGILLLLLLVAAVLQAPAALSQPSPHIEVGPSSISVLPGSTASFRVLMSNNGSDMGFRPVLELVLPVNTTFAGADFMGYKISPDAVYKIPASGTLTYTYPGSAVSRTVHGQPNATVVLLSPIINNIQNGMSLPPLTVSVGVGVNATIGARHVVNVTLIFLYGSDPLDNPSQDPPLASDTEHVAIVPQPLILSKRMTSDGWSDSRMPTGPNYWYAMELEVKLAPRNFTQLNLTDTLPPEAQFVNVTEVEVVSNGTRVNYTLTEPPTDSTGGVIVLRVPEITGGPNSTVRLRYKLFIPYNYTGDGPVITPARQEKRLVNRAFVNATYDGRYAEAGVNYTVVATVDVLYKSAVIYRDNYAPGPSHWDIVKYRVTFYLSDYFNISSLYIRDVLGDGQRVLRNMTPTFWVKNGSRVLSGSFQAGEYVYHGDHAYPGNTTLLEFNLTRALLRVAGNDTLRGGLVGVNWTFDPANFTGPFGRGRTWGYIEFYALVEKEYNGTVPGDRVIDTRDRVSNEAWFAHLVDGHGRNTSASAGLSVAPVVVVKRISHINGAPVSGEPPYAVKPGDNVTFELVVTIPTGNTEHLAIEDYLPPPVFNVSYPAPFSDNQPNVSQVPPPPGEWSIAGDDTVYSLLGLAPTLQVDPGANALIFNYTSNIHRDNTTELKAHIYYTVTFTDRPFGDLLNLANLVVTPYRNSFQQTSYLHEKVVVKTKEPLITVEKRVASTTGRGNVTPGGDLEGADAGDNVTFTINVTNVGHAAAYNLTVADLVQSGQVYMENLTGVKVELCSGPIDASQYSVQVGPDASRPLWLNVTLSSGLQPGDCLLISYNLTVNGNVTPGLAINDTVQVLRYASLPNGENFVTPDTVPRDDAWVSIAPARVDKTLAATSEDYTGGDELTIGENATFALTVTLPEGRVDNLTLDDALPPGLVYNGTYEVDTSGFAGQLPTPTLTTYTAGGVAHVKIVFPGWTNVTADNDPANNAFTVLLTLRVDDSPLNHPKTGRQSKTNTVSLDYDSNPGPPLADSYQVYLVEPYPKIRKYLSASRVDGNDTVTVTIKVWNRGRADAFDVTVWDYLDTSFFNASTVEELSTPAGFAFHYDPASGLVWYTGGPVQAGSSAVTFTFTVRVREDVNASQASADSAYVNFTSLPGPREHERVRQRSYSASIEAASASLAKEYYNSSNPYTQPKDLAVGENVTFKIVVTLPEGRTLNLTVSDELPPGFRFLGYQLDTSGFAGQLPAVEAEPPAGLGGTLNLTFPGWTNVTADNDPANNAFTIYVKARVADDSANQGYPDRQEKTNTASASYATGSAPPASETVYVAEPRLAAGKAANVSVADAGDWVKYTVTVSNTGLAPAFDLNVSDTIDPEVFDLGSLTPVSVPPGFQYSYDPSTGVLLFYPDPGHYPLSVLNGSQSLTFEYAVKLREDVVGLSSYTDTVHVNATSMPHAAADERLYEARASATIRVGGTTLSKVLVNSSETSTAGANLAVGEVAWFNLSFTVPEGRLLNVSVVDVLPTSGSQLLMGYAGRAYVTVNRGNVASNKVSLTPGAWTPIEGVESGGTVSFDLGNITNSNNDPEPETVTICVALVVYNTPGNRRGAALTDSFHVRFVNASGDTVETPSSSYTVRVVEPELWSIVTANPVTLGEAGDVVVFQYNVTNRGDLPYTAPAFDATVFGGLPPELANLTVVSISASGAAGVSDHSTRGGLNVTVERLDPGGWVNITFKAVLKPTAVFGQKIRSAFYANATSLPGPHGSQSLLSCQPGTLCGERTGTGVAPNWIRTGDSIDVAVGIPNVQKKVLAPPPFAVGDEVPFLVIVGTPKGRTDELLVNDTLSQGLSYVDGSLRVKLPGNVEVGNAPSNSSPFLTRRVSGGSETVVFNFSGFQNNNHGSVDTNITFRAIVEDDPAAARGRLLNNTALLRYKADNGSLVDVGPATVHVAVGEPEITGLAKTTLTGEFSGGDTVTFKVEFDNGGDTPAYDTLLVDNLPPELRGAEPRVTVNVGGRPLSTRDYSTTFYPNGTLKIRFVTFHKASPARVGPGEHVEVTIYATAVSQVPLSKTVTNTVEVKSYSSQPGNAAVERTYSGGAASSQARTAGPTVRKEVYTSWTPRPDPGDKTRARAVVGEPAVFNITFSMPRGTVAYKVNFSDTLPDGFTPFNATAYVYNASGLDVETLTIVNSSGRYTVEAELGDLANATVYIVVYGEVSYNYSSGQPLQAGDVLVDGNATNACVFEWSNGAGREEARPNQASIEVVHSEANLTLEKWFSPPSVYLGENATFILRVVNTGNGTAYNVRVRDVLGASLGFLGANATPAVDGQELTWNIGRLEPGEAWAVRVTAETVNCSALRDNATVYWKNPERPSQTLAANASAAIDMRPELNVSVAVLDDPSETGREVRFTVLVHNPSCGEAVHSNISDTLPPGFTYVANSSLLNGTPIGDPHVADGGLLWNLSLDIAPGETYNLTFKALPHNYSSTGADGAAVHVRDRHYYFKTYSGSATAHVLKPLLRVSKTVTPALANTSAAFTANITIVNTGQATAYLLTVTDRLPRCARYLAGTARAGGVDIGNPAVHGRTLTWATRLNLTPGSSTTLTFKFKARCPGEHVNTAKVDYYNFIGEYMGEAGDWASFTVEAPPAGPAPPAPSQPGNQTAPPQPQPPSPPPQPPATPQPRIVVEKRANASAATLNDAVLFTVAVRNLGDGPAENVVVEEELPPCLAYIAGSSRVDGARVEPRVEDGRLVWTLRALPPNSTAVITLAVRVKCRPPSGVMVATARAAGFSSRVSLAFEEPVVRVSKTARLNRDGSITYTVTVYSENYAGTVTLRDTLPPGLTPGPLPRGGVYSGGAITWRLALHKGEKATLTYTARGPAGLCGVYANRVEVAETGAHAEAAVKAVCPAAVAAAAGAALIPIVAFGVLARSKPSVYDYESLRRALEGGGIAGLLRYSDKVLLAPETMAKVYGDPELYAALQPYIASRKVMVAKPPGAALPSTLRAAGLDGEHASAVAAALASNVYRVVFADRAAALVAAHVGLPTVYLKQVSPGEEA